MTEFGGLEVTLCGWQDVKIHLLTNQLTLGQEHWDSSSWSSSRPWSASATIPTCSTTAWASDPSGMTTTTSATMTTSTAKSASRTGRHEQAPVWRRCTKTVQAKTKERMRTICLKNGYCSSNAYNLVTMVLRGKSACLLILCINWLGGWGGGWSRGGEGGSAFQYWVMAVLAVFVR